MTIAILVVLGLCAGSFVNALVWRLHAQSKQTKSKGKKRGNRELSILNGRSKCTHCGHQLSWQDLIPILSWLMLGGKCRYCREPISWQYPLVELATAGLFVASYVFWPGDTSPIADFESTIMFASWLALLAGFVALVVYDLRWMLLPNRIVYPLIVLALATAIFHIATTAGLNILLDTSLSVLIAGGLFYLLFLVSNGRWIGGGDVKLGALIGLTLAEPFQAFLMLLLSSILGTLVVLPGMVAGKVTPKTRIPFGPFLIIAAIIVKLFGAAIIEWYKDSLVI